MEEITKGSAVLHLLLTNSDELVNELETVRTLAGSDDTLLGFVMRKKKKKAEESVTSTVDFREAAFKKFKKMPGHISHG